MNLKQMYSYISDNPNSLFLLESIVKLQFNATDSLEFYTSGDWKDVFDFTIYNSVHMNNE